MPTRTWNVGKIEPNGLLTVPRKAGTMVWSHSPKRNGKFLLQSNPGTFRFARDVAITQRLRRNAPASASYLSPRGVSGLPPRSPVRYVPTVQDENTVLDRFQNRIKRGDRSSLGVTLGSWKQTTGMIFNRTQRISRLLDKRIKVLKSKRGRREIKRRLRQLDWKYGADNRPASLYLEGVFGWQPLFQDIHDSLNVLVRHESYGWSWVRSSLTKTDTYDYSGLDDLGVRSPVFTLRTKASLRQGAMVVVNNPNLFLANKLGMSPLAVAWDLIPWSFVVGMFFNQGQLLRNLTAYAGVTVDNASYVTSVKTDLQRLSTRISSGPDLGSWVHEKTHEHFKDQYKRLLKMQLVYGLPRGNLSLALIATALVDQKFKLVTKLVNKIADRLTSKKSI